MWICENWGAQEERIPCIWRKIDFFLFIWQNNLKVTVNHKHFLYKWIKKKSKNFRLHSIMPIIGIFFILYNTQRYLYSICSQGAQKPLFWNQIFKFKISFLAVSIPGIWNLLDKLLHMYFHPINAEWWNCDSLKMILVIQKNFTTQNWEKLET